MTLRYGVAALGRPTFDVPFAEQKLREAFDALEQAGVEPVGLRTLLYDADAAKEAIAEIEGAGEIDALLIIQVTFTDATMTVEIARNATVPVSIWAIPEPRLGGRLRLNAFCGLNLAAHALGKAGLAHGALYASPDAPNIAEDLRALAMQADAAPSRAARPAPVNDDNANRALAELKDARISVFGKHPDGFDTCAYNEGELAALSGVKVSTFGLDALFDKAKSIDASRVAAVRGKSAEALTGLDDVDQEQLDRSFRLFCALEDFQQESNAQGLAVRCWPETFTEYGCAACGPMAMMNQKRVPSACEADVYGSFSALMLQTLAQAPAWMADLVDLDFEDDTGVFWHCGLAPLSMCDPEAEAEATIHTNRKMPLLHQFPLKPGKFTVARLSQSRNKTKLVIGAAAFLRAPMAFTGTSGVMKFDCGARKLFDTIVAEGLEHHYAIAYGDHRQSLRAISAAFDIPLLELT